MQISGRVIILAMFGIALALSGGAWWYHYSTTRRAAEFWGADGARLLGKAPEITFFELADPATETPPEQAIGGYAVAAEHDLSGKPGLVHLRFVFTQDANFSWDRQASQRVGQAGVAWAHALRFAEGEEQLVVLLRDGFEQIGKLEGDEVRVLPSVRIASSVRRYLTDIGVLNSEGVAKPQAAATQQAAGR